MFFDGEYASKRKVNLRGSSRHDQDKQLFLEKQKQERERRQLEKKRQKSATVIQAFYRGRSRVGKRRDEERARWDGDIMALSGALEVRTLSSLLKRFIFFYRDPVDDVRLHKMCELVLSSITNTDHNLNYLTLCVDPSTRPSWLHQTKCLLNFCQKKISTRNPVYLQLMDMLTDISVLGHFLQDQTLARNVVIYHLDKLIGSGLFRYIRQYFTSTPVVQNQVHAHGLLRLALRRFNNVYPPPAPTTTAGLLGAILSIPGLVSSLPVAMVQQELVGALAVALAHAATAPETELRPYLAVCDDIEALAANLLELVPSLIDIRDRGDAVDAMLLSYLKIINFLLSSIPPVSHLPKSYDDIDEAATVIPQRSSVLTSQLNKVVATPVVRRLFQHFLPPVSASPVTSSIPSAFLPTLPSVDVLLPPGLVALCRLMDIIHNHNLWDPNPSPHPARIGMLNALALGTPVVRTLWVLLSQSRELLEMSKGIRDRETDQGHNQLLFPTLSLWAKCYSHVLFTLDDQEFFEQQLYFSLDELRHMSRILKKVVFRMYWTTPGRQSAMATREPQKASLSSIDENVVLRNVLTTLLRQIYDRNARHSFCPDGHWIVEEVYTTALRGGDGSTIDITNDKVSLILKNIPFVIPFSERVKIFHQLITQDKHALRLDEHFFYGDTRVSIRRNFIFEDGFASLNHIGEKLKSRIRVEFINSEGLPEAGVDGGGLFKDFITELVKTAFDPRYALFLTTPDRHMYPNPSSSILTSEHLRQLEFLGRILGKALYEGILVELPLAPFFLSKLLGKHNYVNDLVFLDPQLHRNLMYLKTYPGNVEDLALTFTVVDNEFGEAAVHELIPGGKDIAVTNENRIRYIYLVANHRLNVQIKTQCDAFLRGFSDLIHPEWIRMFSQDELQFLISGSPTSIDIVDMRANTTYSGGYSDDHPVINMFWQIVSEMTPAQQRDLLKFVTSCSRPPLLGFAYLHPHFCIHVSRGDVADPDNYLPTASTCLNLLKLPPYSHKSVMREKLLYAISSGSGFDLS
jgi:ubiquitin-protein ligase E3 C